ncbi:GDCCVxC domain-containing (seleno)protein [Flavitalea flava]
MNQFFYVYKNCKARLKPKEGDCFVFCSYGDQSAPQINSSKGLITIQHSQAVLGRLGAGIRSSARGDEFDDH